MLWQVSPLADDAPLEADLAAYRPKPLIKPPCSRRTLSIRSGGKLLVHKTWLTPQRCGDELSIKPRRSRTLQVYSGGKLLARKTWWTPQRCGAP